jgi:hypothetical protein
MWSTKAGAEVMKPIAAPVIGGMFSSLLHILIVTPVIFFWLRRRSLRHVSGCAPRGGKTDRRNPTSHHAPDCGVFFAPDGK